MKHKAKGASGSPAKSCKGGSGSSAGTRGAGKGKGRSGGLQQPASGGSTVDLKDVPLNLHDLSVADHAQWVPRYHAVLRRSENDGVGMEDLNTLQLELEAMLAAAVLKKISLREEVGVLENVDRFRGTSSASGSAGRRGPGSPGKRSATTAASDASGVSGAPGTSSTHSAKRFKAAGKASEKVNIGLPKIKSEQPIPQFDPLQNEQIRPSAQDAASKPALPKNETPNRFWAFVEPYCAPITVDDIKLLEDLIKTHNDMTEYYRIPPLGQHYTQRWAKEDLENERLKSAANATGAVGVGGEESNDSSGESGKILRKGEAAAAASVGSGEESPFGDLTKRLVGGLLEENIMTSVEEAIDANKIKTEPGDKDDKSNLIKSLNVTNSDSLEARVKKELEEQGLWNPEEDAAEGETTDEILEELHRCQNELRAVSAHNLAQLRRVLKAAKEEMIRQELRQKMAQADAEVIDAYQKVSLARSRKKAPSKKEREHAWKALKERELILKELESV